MNRLEFDRRFPAPVLGLDEVGTGAIAGPIVVCGLVLPGDQDVEELLLKAGAADSKRLSPTKRETLARLIREHFIWHFIVQIEASDYVKGGMTRHLDDLFRRVLSESLARGPDAETIIIDGNQSRNLRGHHFHAIPKADDKSLTVACASIAAKVHRDKIMREVGALHPGYGFSNHKGYPTKHHLEVLKERGALPGIHRDCKVVRRITGAPPPPPEEASIEDLASRNRKASDASAVRRFRPGSERFR